MAQTEGSVEAFSTDQHLNESINDVLNGFADEGLETGAAPTPTQDGTQVESPREIPEPSTGDRGRSATPPDASASPPSPAPDPDPQYEPFTYPVDGETRTMDGSFRIPGEGLFVPEAHVPRWQQIAAQAETLERQNRDIVERSQFNEKLTEWQVLKGVDPQTRQPIIETFRGVEGIRAQRVAMAEAREQARVYVEALNNPEKFHTLYQIVTDERGEYGPAGAQYVVPSASGIATLKKEAALAVREAVLGVNTHFSQYPRQAAPPAPAPDAPVSELAMPTVEATVKQLNVTGLSAEDKKFLADQLPRYVRPTTPEEKAAGLGTRIVDASFGVLIQREGARVSTLSQSAQAKAAADKWNNGQQKGRAGQRPAAPAPAPTPTPEPKRRRNSRNEKSGLSWDAILERGLNDPDVQATLNGAA